MFVHEEKMRTLVSRIAKATVAGEITWRQTGWGCGSYATEWCGYHLVAEWLKDEIYLEIVRDGKVAKVPGLIMNCLHDIILAQIEPERADERKRHKQKADRIEIERDRCEKEMFGELLKRSKKKT